MVAPNSAANVWSSALPTARTRTTTARTLSATRNSSQKPARVSMLLRSSTPVRRGSGGRVG